MEVARPITEGGKDQLRFKILGELTAVMGGMSSQTAERMRAGDAIKKALQKLAHDCIGIDWELVYNKLGIKLDGGFDLSEVAGIRKIPVMPRATEARVARCIIENGCPVDTHLLGEHSLGSISSCAESYMVRISDYPGGAGLSRLDTKARSINEPTLVEWLLLQLGFVICSGRPWGDQHYVRCGGSQITDPEGIRNPFVSVPLLPPGCRAKIEIGTFREDKKNEYLYTFQVTGTTR